MYYDVTPRAASQETYKSNINQINRNEVTSLLRSSVYIYVTDANKVIRSKKNFKLNMNCYDHCQLVSMPKTTIS